MHTILILDKELHAFPWESLPCMSINSVSRMPCMQEIHDRVDAIHQQKRIAMRNDPHDLGDAKLHFRI